MEKCHGMTDRGNRCKILTCNKKYFSTLLLPTCDYHKDSDILMRWMNYQGEEMPMRIRQYFRLFGHCLTILKMNPILSNMIAGELHNIASFYYPSYMLSDVFFDIILKKSDDRVTCPICYEESKNTIITRCGHSFCNDCIISWVSEKGSCPMCRELISKLNIK